MGDLTGVYPEHGARRQYPRWVAVYRTPTGFRHLTLTITTATHDRAEAEAEAGKEQS